jgi:S-adenosylmethionine hydrolase
LIVTLLSDFGLADPYVAAMKGVSLSRDPRIVTIDISHEIPRHDIREAAFVLGSCFREFPPGTVHLAVVDPGVGSSRRPLAIRSEGYFFVGPDNGLFGDIGRGTDREVREIDSATLVSRRQSSTFHGRDIFAPAAAALATGVQIAYLGPPVGDMKELHETSTRKAGGGVLEGQIIHIDRFGNCVTSFRAVDFFDADPGRYQLQIGKVSLGRSRSFYSEEASEEPFTILGSSGHLEISINRRSAAEGLNLQVGDTVLAIPRSDQQGMQDG